MRHIKIMMRILLLGFDTGTYCTVKSELYQCEILPLPILPQQVALLGIESGTYCTVKWECYPCAKLPNYTTNTTVTKGKFADYHPLVLPVPLFTRVIGLLWNQVQKHCTSNLKFCSFSCLPMTALFSLNFSLRFLSIQKRFEPEQPQWTILSSISGIKPSWRTINIDYPPHLKVGNLIPPNFPVFPPNWVILVISLLKSTQNL